jgi:adenylate cyclase
VLKEPQLKSLALAVGAWLVLFIAYAVTGPTRAWINDVDVLAMAWRFQTRGLEQPWPGLRVLGLTENTIQAFSDCGIGYSHFPRNWHALALRRLADAGAKVVVFDILFSESRGAGEDGALRDAIAYAEQQGCAVVLAAGIEDIQYADGVSSKSLLQPNPALMQAQPALGISNTQPKLSYKLVEYGQFSLAAGAGQAVSYEPQAVAAFRLYCAQSGVDFAAAMRKATGSTGCYRINYCGPVDQLTDLVYQYEVLYPGLFEQHPERELTASGQAALKRAFAGSVVFIGSRAKADNDYFNTPYGLMYGVDTNALAFDTLARQNFIYGVPPLAVLLITLLLAAGAWALSLIRPLWRSVAAGAAVLALLLLSNFMLFLLARLELSCTMQLAGFMLPYITCALYSGLSEEAAKLRIRSTFSKYVSDQIVDQIIANPNLADLGGSERAVAVLFNDIRNYSTITEHLSPQQVVQLLNIYFGEITEVIRAHRGFVDKYLGDGLMACFGGPVPTDDPASDAIHAALEMVRALHERVLPRLAAAGLPAFKAGIGIHVGKVVMGNIGSETRMDYTVIGDVVNVASRAEGQTKEFGCAIVVTREALASVRGDFFTEFLGERLVKGRGQPVMLYRVFDPQRPEMYII